MYVCVYLVGSLEHGIYDFPYIGNTNPNWLSYFSEGLKPPTSIGIYIYIFRDIINGDVHGYEYCQQYGVLVVTQNAVYNLLQFYGKFMQFYVGKMIFLATPVDLKVPHFQTNPHLMFQTPHMLISN